MLISKGIADSRETLFVEQVTPKFCLSLLRQGVDHSVDTSEGSTTNVTLSIRQEWSVHTERLTCSTDNDFLHDRLHYKKRKKKHISVSMGALRAEYLYSRKKNLRKNAY